MVGVGVFNHRTIFSAETRSSGAHPPAAGPDGGHVTCDGTWWGHVTCLCSIRRKTTTASATLLKFLCLFCLSGQKLAVSAVLVISHQDSKPFSLPHSGHNCSVDHHHHGGSEVSPDPHQPVSLTSSSIDTSTFIRAESVPEDQSPRPETTAAHSTWKIWLPSLVLPLPVLVPPARYPFFYSKAWHPLFSAPCRDEGRVD